MKAYLDGLKWGLIEISKYILNKIANYGLQGKQNLIIRFYNHFDNNFILEDEFTTITIQNNNQNLTCNQDSFSVNIKINGFNKRITVPFDAIALILDPSARFGLELGEVFDEYSIKNPKNSSPKDIAIKKIDKNTLVFNENIEINKFNYGGSDYQMDYVKITKYYLTEVVKKLLKLMAPSKNTYNENFLVEFKPQYPGVIFPSHLTKNKELLTISFTEKYFNLMVEEEGFSVFLSFNDNLQKVFIPYNAITNFFNPFVNFKVDLTFVDYIDQQIMDQPSDKIMFVDF